MISATIIAAFAGLASSFGWGVGDFFAAKASKATSPAITQLIVAVLSAGIFTIIFWLFMRASAQFHVNGLLYCAAAGIFMTLASVSFYRGLQIGPVSLVSPIAAAYPLITTVIVLAVFKDKLNTTQLSGIVVIVAGVLAASGVIGTKTTITFSPGIAYALVTAVLWGFGYALLGPAVDSLGWQMASLVQLLVMAATYLLLFKVFYKDERVKLIDLHPRKNTYAILNALIAIFAIVVFNFGITYAASTAVVTAISASYPAITIFLALRQFKEEIRIIPLLGGFVSIAGVVLLAIG